MRLPVKEVWCHHSVTSVTGNPMADMRQLQQVAFSRKFSDVSYSYAIHPSGVVLEGRGLAVGAHTAGRNSKSFGVCLIGDYSKRVVTDAQVDSIRQLVAHLIERGALNPGLYPTGGHRQAPGAATACPGEFAMRRLVEMRAPWVAIPDLSPAPRFVDYPEEPSMRRYDIAIALDNQGNGYTEPSLDVPYDRVVSLLAHGPYPKVDGYWNLPVLGRQDRDGKTVVTATEGPPNTTVSVTLWALD
jgi:N-acetylmuramoyl-L-alanine amidase-like protein